MEPPERVIAIGRFGKTAPVHRSRCSLIQQLSGPLTDTKRCVTSQLVPEEGGAGGEGRVGEGVPTARGVSSSATASVTIWAFMAEKRTLSPSPQAVRGAYARLPPRQPRRREEEAPLCACKLPLLRRDVQ